MSRSPTTETQIHRKPNFDVDDESFSDDRNPNPSTPNFDVVDESFSEIHRKPNFDVDDESFSNDRN